MWVRAGGVEYSLVLGAIAFAVTATGAGTWSLDHVLGLHVRRARGGASLR